MELVPYFCDYLKIQMSWFIAIAAAGYFTAFGMQALGA
jgi:hypothetical protein